MVEAHFSSDGYHSCITCHHKHMKLVKPFTQHVIACSVRKVFFDQSICRTLEQKASLQCLANAMPTSVLPWAKNRKVSKEKKYKNLAVLAEMPRLERFFF